MLRDAVRRGSVAQMRHALAQGADLEATDRKRGRTPLHLAIFEGRLAMVQALIAAGSDVNALDAYAFSPLLLSSGLHDDATAILDALISAGADVHYWAGDDGTALTGAARAGYPRQVAALIQAGAQVNDPRPTVSALASVVFSDDFTDGHLDALRILIAFGADVNATDEQGWTPLMWAARFDEGDAAQVLLDAGADLQMSDASGLTARAVALEHGGDQVLAVIDKVMLTAATHSEPVAGQRRRM
jgi:ankyrin repeat protein